MVGIEEHRKFIEVGIHRCTERKRTVFSASVSVCRSFFLVSRSFYFSCMCVRAYNILLYGTKGSRQVLPDLEVSNWIDQFCVKHRKQKYFSHISMSRLPAGEEMEFSYPCFQMFVCMRRFYHSFLLFFVLCLCHLANVTNPIHLLFKRPLSYPRSLPILILCIHLNKATHFLRLNICFNLRHYYMASCPRVKNC